MSVGLRHPGASALVSASCAILALLSCKLPWNADLKTFVDDGRTTVAMEGFTAEAGGSKRSVLPSGRGTVVTLDLRNPRSIKISCGISWESDALYSSLPEISSQGPERILVSFTPSLQAERKDLKLTVDLSAPTINRTFPPAVLTIHCNTPPGGVGATLDAALDGSGRAFAAFRLPSAPTDDDLAKLEISYAKTDGAGDFKTITLAADDPSLLAGKETSGGVDILGADDPLDRYFQPEDIVSGENYTFRVTILDGEGLRSETKEATSDATAYSVSYDGNGNTGGSAPSDPATYRQTKTVVLPDPGGMVRTGYTFAGWNTAADGSGTAYAAGASFAMPARDASFYAQWAINIYRVDFDSKGGSEVASQKIAYGSLASCPPPPARSGYAFGGWYRDLSFTQAWSFASDAVTADLGLYARWAELEAVVVGFTLNPAYGTITFSSPSATVVRGGSLLLKASPALATGWHWYVDNELQAETGPEYSWNTAGVKPGQYVINVDALCEGYPCTGSIRVTVTY
jgi:uncharacterized repeat protein (TIGR02543 family)